MPYLQEELFYKIKGPYEILRHHRTDRHLRRDQRWRYEHLRSVDPVSGKVQHRVRGANGKILTKIELANQLPKFINAELVDIGERFPFYEDFIRGTTTALVTQEARVKTQLCLVGDSQGVQSCFRFEQLSLPTLMHKSKYSVFGQIDFFPVLQALMVSLGGSLTEEWAMRSPELTKVSTSLRLSFSGRGSVNLGTVGNNSQQQNWF